MALRRLNAARTSGFRFVGVGTVETGPWTVGALAAIDALRLALPPGPDAVNAQSTLPVQSAVRSAVPAATGDSDPETADAPVQLNVIAVALVDVHEIANLAPVVSDWGETVTDSVGADGGGDEPDGADEPPPPHDEINNTAEQISRRWNEQSTAIFDSSDLQFTACI